MNSDTIRDDPIQLAHTLRAFAELRQTGAVTEAEYESLKVDVLAALALRIKRDPADRPLVGGRRRVGWTSANMRTTCTG